jgi:hypothetical protein
MIALLTYRGTAAAETALCRVHDDESTRNSVESDVFHSGLSRDVQLDTWTDCTDNNFLRCCICGAGEK